MGARSSTRAQRRAPADRAMNAVGEAMLGVAWYVTLRGALPVALPAVGLERTLSALRAIPARRGHHADLARYAEWAVNRVPFLPRTCLYRSLAQFGVECLAGREATFVMGVRRTGDDLVGHAWLELDGVSLDSEST